MTGLRRRTLLGAAPAAVLAAGLAPRRLSAQPRQRLLRFIPQADGQFVIPTAYRKNLYGIIIAPIPFLWNVGKT